VRWSDLLATKKLSFQSSFRIPKSPTLQQSMENIPISHLDERAIKLFCRLACCQCGKLGGYFLTSTYSVVAKASVGSEISAKFPYHCTSISPLGGTMHTMLTINYKENNKKLMKISLAIHSKIAIY